MHTLTRMRNLNHIKMTFLRISKKKSAIISTLMSAYLPAVCTQNFPKKAVHLYVSPFVCIRPKQNALIMCVLPTQRVLDFFLPTSVKSSKFLNSISCYFRQRRLPSLLSMPIEKSVKNVQWMYIIIIIDIHLNI